MILFLTYHKVARRGQAAGDFYTVSEDALERQLEMVRENGFQFLAPEEILMWRTTEVKQQTASSRQPSPPKEEREKAPEAVCIPSFDDGTADHFDVVVPLLERRKCRALFFVPTARLNRPKYLTTQQLVAMRRAGHTVGSHSHEHERLDRLAEEDVRVQLEISRQILSDALGAPPRFFAPPGGYFSALVQRVAIEQDLTVIRTMRWGYNHRPVLASLECVPINRNVTEVEFRRVLEGRDLRLAYAGKQLAKSLVPGWLYEKLRGSASNVLR